ncbi:MAG: putative sulfate/molybdate transporter [Phycisphaeraceae bacterium]|nr:putative sulfate/molybdate transporter [Phycisphaeraceae bacterium]
MTLASTWRGFTSLLVPRHDAPLRFDARELSGSLGDLGTFLPLAFAMALTCGMDIGLIFIFAGLMNVATGWFFRQPIPVQPMKAIAAVAIAEGLSAGAIASAGLVMGVAMFTLAVIGGVNMIVRLIPKPVVRGIQAGIGLKLTCTGIVWLGGLPAIGWDSWILALTVGVAVALTFRRRLPVLLVAFVGGFVLLWLAHPDAFRLTNLHWPRFHVVSISNTEWWIGLTRGAIPQLPLTLLNSVIAVCALSSDCFPGRGIVPKRMAASVGLMNLVCVPFGGMPMCHGAGGLAAQYRFGARTGGSVVMLGSIKIVAGLMLGGMLIHLLQLYPVSILAVMVIVAGISLMAPARDALSQVRSAAIVLLMASTIVLVNTLVGFALGCALAFVFAAADRLRRTSH